MIAFKILAAAVISTVLVILFGILLIVPIVATSTGTGATTGVLSITASDEAINDIPATLLPIYISAAAECEGLPWTVAAGIGKIESDHARFGGATINPDGQVLPPIIGIRLDGTNNTAIITDTDNGALDNDTLYDRAVGPFQFIPSSWALYGRDGNNDTIKDPHNVYDAIPAMVAHLCPHGSITNIEDAIFSYNRSTAYVADVLAWAGRYTGSAVAVPVAGYALPLPGITEALATRPHHTYPAWDAGVDVGTPTFAMVDGTVAVALSGQGVYDGGNTGRCGNTVIIDGIDSVRYTYCHLSAVSVAPGQTVTAGQQLGLTGGQPGAPGAGNTTGPHLHLSLRGQGRQLCPQPVLLSILRQTPINPHASPSTGCITGAPNINWDQWGVRDRAASPQQQ